MTRAGCYCTTSLLVCQLFVFLRKKAHMFHPVSVEINSNYQRGRIERTRRKRRWKKAQINIVFIERYRISVRSQVCPSIGLLVGLFIKQTLKCIMNDSDVFRCDKAPL